MDFLKKFKAKKNKFSEELISQTVDLEIEDAIGDLKEETGGDVLSFRVDYLGCLPVEYSQDFRPEEATKFLKNELDKTKKKKQRGVILISPNFFTLTDMKVKEIFKIPILRISSCSLDPCNKNIFFFICGDKEKRKTYHAFSCDKWKNAHNAALAIAHMFSQCHENYLRDQYNKKFCGDEKENTNNMTKHENESQRFSLDMMDFSMDTSPSIMENTNPSKNWVSFDD